MDEARPVEVGVRRLVVWGVLRLAERPGLALEDLRRQVERGLNALQGGEAPPPSLETTRKDLDVLRGWGLRIEGEHDPERYASRDAGEAPTTRRRYAVFPPTSPRPPAETVDAVVALLQALASDPSGSARAAPAADTVEPAAYDPEAARAARAARRKAERSWRVWPEAAWPWPVRTGLLRLLATFATREDESAPELPFVVAEDTAAVPLVVCEPTLRGRGRPARGTRQPRALLDARFLLETAIAERRAVHCDYNPARRGAARHRNLRIEPLWLEDHGHRAYVRAVVPDWGQRAYTLRLDRFAGDPRGGPSLRLDEPNSAAAPGDSPAPWEAPSMSERLPQVSDVSVGLEGEYGRPQAPLGAGEDVVWDEERGVLRLASVPRRELLAWALRHADRVVSIEPAALHDSLVEALEHLAEHVEFAHEDDAEPGAAAGGAPPREWPPESDVEALGKTLVLAAATVWNSTVASAEESAHANGPRDPALAAGLDVRRWLPQAPAHFAIDAGDGHEGSAGVMALDVLGALEEATGRALGHADLVRAFGDLLPVEERYLAHALTRAAELVEPMTATRLRELAGALTSLPEHPRAPSATDPGMVLPQARAAVAAGRPVVAEVATTPTAPLRRLRCVPLALVSDHGHRKLRVAIPDRDGAQEDLPLSRLERLTAVGAPEAGASGTPPRRGEALGDLQHPVSLVTDERVPGAMEVTLQLGPGAWWIQDLLPRSVWSEDRSGAPITVVFFALDREWVVSTVLAAAGEARVLAPSDLASEIAARAQAAAERLRADDETS